MPSGPVSYPNPSSLRAFKPLTSAACFLVLQTSCRHFVHGSILFVFILTLQYSIRRTSMVQAPQERSLPSFGNWLAVPATEMGFDALNGGCGRGLGSSFATGGREVTFPVGPWGEGPSYGLGESFLTGEKPGLLAISSAGNEGGLASGDVDGSIVNGVGGPLEGEPCFTGDFKWGPTGCRAAGVEYNEKPLTEGLVATGFGPCAEFADGV